MIIAGFEFLISCGTAPPQVEVVSALVQQFETMRMFKKSLVAVASWENPQKEWLVVGLEQFYFSIYWECHHPSWLIFFKGVGIPPTRWDEKKIHFATGLSWWEDVSHCLFFRKHRKKKWDVWRKIQGIWQKQQLVARIIQFVVSN